MKVLFVWHSLVEPEYRKIIDALQVTGADVLALLPHEWREGGRDLKAECLLQDSFRVFHATNKNRINRFFFPNIAEVFEIIRAFSPDILHIFEEPTSLVALELVGLVRIVSPRTKIVVQSFENIWIDRTFPVSAIEKLVLHFTHCMITVPVAGFDIWKEKGFKGRMEQVPVGVDVTLFSPSEPEKTSHPSSTGTKIGYAGRLVEEKGIYDLLEACMALAEAGYRITLVYRGNGPEMEALMQKAGNLPPLLSVEILPALPTLEINGFYRSIDILVLPSKTTPIWKEQFGRVLIEAMACGVPVIGSSSGEIPHVIDKGGLVFEEGNSDSLAECLLCLIDTPALYDRLSKTARQTAEQNYSWRSVAEKLAKIYGSLLLGSDSQKGHS